MIPLCFRRQRRKAFNYFRCLHPAQGMLTDSGPARAPRTPVVSPSTVRQPAPARQGLRSAGAELALLPALLTGRSSLAPRRGLSVSSPALRCVGAPSRAVAAFLPPTSPFPDTATPSPELTHRPWLPFLAGDFPLPEGAPGSPRPCGGSAVCPPASAPVPAELRAALRARGGGRGGPGAAVPGQRAGSGTCGAALGEESASSPHSPSSPGGLGSAEHPAPR